MQPYGSLGHLVESLIRLSVLYFLEEEFHVRSLTIPWMALLVLESALLGQTLPRDAAVDCAEALPPYFVVVCTPFFLLFVWLVYMVFLHYIPHCTIMSSFAYIPFFFLLPLCSFISIF